MSDQWIPFEGRPFGNRKDRGLRVTVNARHVMYLNKNAYSALGEPEAVEFLFNPETQVIGMRSAPPQLESSFAVVPKRIQGMLSGYVVHASAFMVDLKMFPARTLQFNKITIDRHGLMHLRLDSMTAIGRVSR